MNQTRREFIVTSAVAVCALGVVPASGRPAGGKAGEDAGTTPMFEGDPYLAFVDDGGLGGRTYDEALEHALRFRSTPEDRDKYVLGLEL